MHGTVSNEEWDIFRDAYQFFAAHADPPANQDAHAVDWWTQTAQDVCELDNRWTEIPLMRRLLLGIYEYLDFKAKEKTKEVAEFVQEQ